MKKKAKELKIKRGESAKRNGQKPEARERMAGKGKRRTDGYQRAALKRWQDPKRLEKHRETIKQTWSKRRQKD